jgi:nicotinate phosphoribosyltransferase
MQPHSGLLTDLYELTMAAGYVQTGFNPRATFELFVRDLPPRRNFLVAAGLEQALEHLENVRFTAGEIEFLRAQPVFRRVGPEFFDYLAAFRFTGDVWAMPEGTLAFAGEPMLRVTAPLAEAQILETYLLAALNFSTMIASKAARVVMAARGRNVVEFGTRRAHTTGAGILAARAAYLAGCHGTSNVLAGHLFGIPLFGTQAHSWIMAHEDEAEAFAKFLEIFPEHATLLVDTYSVRSAVEKIIRAGRKPRGIRLDSGDLVADSQWARRRLDEAGWQDVHIFASGDLDEDRIEDLLARGARINGFGVGTALSTSADAPSLGVIYKLVEVERGGEIRGAVKLSHDKATLPGRKQVFRFRDAGGKFSEDVIALEGEEQPGGEALLVPVMRAGRRVAPAPALAEIRRRCLDSVESLPDRFRRLDAREHFPVRLSAHLEALLEQVRGRLRSSR